MSDWVEHPEEGLHRYEDDFYMAEVTPSKRGWDIEGYLTEDADVEYFSMQGIKSLTAAKRACEELFGVFRKIRRTK